jgi:hypothetical protein
VAFAEADTLERPSRYAWRSASEILIVRLLMRDARSSPSTISFRTVDRAHWSFALTCATVSSFETGMFLYSLRFSGEHDGQNIARELCR